ncbi:MAG: protoheme IX farnesyltransferase [Caldilineaceae bacterium]|nr:protoheme IX farnesyltransferase [Caldilineaceae bacterium]
MQLPDSAFDHPALVAPTDKTAPSFSQISLRDYVALTKPTIISLLLVVTLVPMFLAGNAPPSPMLIFWAMLGGFLAAGGANTINQFMDRDIDHVMLRTAKRPLPSGRMTPGHVLMFGVLLSVASFVLLWSQVNLLTALLALSGILLYLFLYTGLLKRTSTQNIVVGGAAGCIPPLVGWAAVANELSLLPLIMFMIIFYWTPPHFWALALMRQKEYAAAGVPMLPVVAGENETRRHIVLYSVLLLLISVLPFFLHLLGPIYLAGALLLNGIFLWQAVELWRKPTNGNTWRLYKYSLLFLALLFLAMGIDGLFYAPPVGLANVHWRL